MRLLIVEDEEDLRHLLCRGLKKDGYAVDAGKNGEEAMDFIRVGEYDAIVLDRMMPVMDGDTFLVELRKRGNKTPVLLLTAKDEVEDRIKGLDAGADDYLPKPFHLGELRARLRALIRRGHGEASNLLVIDDLEADLSTGIVVRQGKDISLSPKEYEMLIYFLQNRGRILSREELIDHLWGFDYEGESNVVDVMVKNIRRKLGGSEEKPLIHTRRGRGYVMEVYP